MGHFPEDLPIPAEQDLVRHLDLRVDRHDPAIIDTPAEDDFSDRLDIIIQRMRKRPGTTA